MVLNGPKKRENTRMCRSFTLCLVLLPYVSLTRFGECADVRISTLAGNECGQINIVIPSKEIATSWPSC